MDNIIDIANNYITENNNFNKELDYYISKFNNYSNSLTTINNTIDLFFKEELEIINLTNNINIITKI